jgi:Flp pilus assembly pilin Flp
MPTTRRRTLLGRGRHDGGASAVEYALILAGVAILSIGAIFALGRTAKVAFTNATSVVSTQPAGVLPVVSEPATAGPGTTSAAPTTTSAAPTTSSAAPTTTSAAPTPAPSPTTTLAQLTDTAQRGQTTKILDLSGTVTNTSVSMTPDVGSIAWNGNNIEIDVANSGSLVGTVVTVTYSYTQNGVNYTGTIKVTVIK